MGRACHHGSVKYMSHKCGEPFCSKVQQICRRSEDEQASQQYRVAVNIPVSQNFHSFFKPEYGASHIEDNQHDGDDQHCKVSALYSCGKFQTVVQAEEHGSQ